MSFCCGVAKRCITPPVSLLPDLRGLKNTRIGGVMDDLYVRVLAMRDSGRQVFLIAFDLNMPPCTQESLERLALKLGTGRENIFFWATHTHAVPVVTQDLHERVIPMPEVQQAVQEYLALVEEMTLQAAQEAAAAAQPARMGYAFGKSCINQVRLQNYTYRDADGCLFTVCNLGADPQRFADPRLGVIRFETLAGRPLGFLVNYAVHNVAAIWNDWDGNGAMGISGDIAGRVSTLIEQEYGGVALWSSGAAGDLNPQFTNEIILPDPETGRPREIKPEGRRYAEHCLQIMSWRHYDDIKRVLAQITCAENPDSVCAAVTWSVTPGCDCIRHPGQPPEFIVGPQVAAHTVQVRLMKIGTLTLCGLGAEVYSSIGRAVLTQLPENSLLITHDCSTICRCHYILDDETIARCDASHGYAMVPGYDEYRCCAGVIEEDLCACAARLENQLEGCERL